MRVSRPSGRSRLRPQATVEARPGLVIEDVTSGFVGEILDVRRVAGEILMVLEDRHGQRRRFPLGPGFWIDGEPVNLVAPSAKSAAIGLELTASGSIRTRERARTMVPHRLWVEGKHDWQLIDKVWGEDLRREGIAVEELAGVDRLPDMLATFAPSPQRRAGILVDHFLPGTKEYRIVSELLADCPPGSVLALGHPYVDVWQAIKPERVGLTAWPTIPRDEDIKVGTLARLGLPHETIGDVGRGWQAILSRVRDWKDLEPALLGRVEELIDFLAPPGP